MTDITADKLNDLRRRILDHEKAVASGDASPAKPPYTLEELKDALAAISLNRETVATTPAAKRKPAVTVDLDSLL